MPFTDTFLPAVTGVQRVPALLNLLRDYISASENLEGAEVTATFEDAPAEMAFSSYIVYTVRLPAQKQYDENGTVIFDPFELP